MVAQVLPKSRNRMIIAAQITHLLTHAMSDNLIEITVNGEARSIAEGTTVAELLVALGLGEGRVAVERNREVIPRADHDQTQLDEGDRVEVVTFVGGG